MRHRSIIEELNREKARELAMPLLMALITGPVCIAGIILVYCYAGEIDGIGTRYWEPIGWFLVIGSLVGIVKIVKR